MSCPACDAPTVAVAVPPALAEYLPEEVSAVDVCTRCLTVTPREQPPTDAGDVTAVSDAIPRGSEAAAAVVCLLALLDSPGLYRTELTAIVEHLERAGVDPFLVLDRLGADDGLDPAFDVDRRTRQLEQLV